MDEKIKKKKLFHVFSYIVSTFLLGNEFAFGLFTNQQLFLYFSKLYFEEDQDYASILFII